MLLGGAASPVAVITTLLLAAATIGFIEHLRSRDITPLLSGGLAMGFLVLVDFLAWPLFLVVSIALLVAPDATWVERRARLLVALFPALFMTMAWAGLNWTETGWPLYFLHVPPLSLHHMEQWASHLRGPTFSAPIVATLAIPRRPSSGCFQPRPLLVMRGCPPPRGCWRWRRC